MLPLNEIEMQLATAGDDVLLSPVPTEVISFQLILGDQFGDELSCQEGFLQPALGLLARNHTRV